MSTCNSEYGMLFNVLCLFAFVYFIDKFSRIIECYIANHIYPYFGKKKHDYDVYDPNKDSKIVLLETQVKNLSEQLDVMNKRCEELQLKFKKINQKYCISLLVMTGFPVKAMDSQTDSQELKAYLKDDDDLKETTPPCLGVWMKYLVCMKGIMPVVFPKVVSTDDVQKLRGLNYS